MSAETNAASMQGGGATVNAENPWPGLLAFRETDQEFFQGRRSETEDLFRMVMRERLVVLFGLSGLGKSSLLQAGLFPLVRPHSVLPVYLRLDFSAGAIDLADQIITTVIREATTHQIEAPLPVERDTLWEYFHRDGHHFWNARNRPVMPLLVFDQFEELFTLGRLDGRAAATESLIAELADLAEGRPPAALKSHIDSHPEEAAGFQFGRHHYKMLMSIREDFLPELESLRAHMPALATNRLRLRRMNGVAATDVVSQAKDLIDADVARQVVRFVAADSGDRPLADLEVEPVLLSVVCRELNSKRLNLGLPRMTAELLEGSQQQVLTDFYERSTADLAPGVRAFIEDHLLTLSGYRDSVAVENALSTPGMTPAIIDDLVGRRLVRREDRGGVQRLELTHDLLAGVVRASRDTRRLKEQAEVEQQALLKAQEAERLERERAQEAENRARDKRILNWSRIAVAVVLVLLVIAVVAAVLAGMAAERATRAERVSSARELATASLLNLDVDPQLSLLLALAAIERAETVEAAEVLHRAIHADRVLFSLPMRVEPEDADAIELSLDETGSHIAILERNGKMTTWDVSGPAPTRSEKDVFGEYGTAAFSPDRKMLALASNGRPVRLWSVAEERLLAELTAEDAAYREYRKLAFSPSGRFLAVSRCPAVLGNQCPGAVMEVWDVIDRKRIGQWPSIDGKVGAIAWSADTSLVAGGGKSLIGDQGQVVRIGLIAVWRNTADAAAPALFTDAEFRDISGVAVVAADKSSSVIYSSPAINHVKELDLLSGDMVSQWAGHTGGLRALSLGAGGALVATASADHTARIWDPVTHQERFALRGHTDEVQKLAFSGDGKRLVTLGPDMLKVWNVAANGELASWWEPPGGTLLGLSADGRHMTVRRTSGLVVIDLMSGNTRDIPGPVDHAPLSRDGQRLAHSFFNTVIAIEDAATGRALSSPNTADGFLFQLEFSGNGARLLLITDGSPRVWDVDAGRYLPRPAGVEFNALGGAISENGKVVAVQAEESEVVVVWDLANGQTSKMSPGADYRARLTLSPDGKRLAANAPSERVIVWDTTSGRSLHTLAGHAGETTAITFSADGRLLASSGADKMTKIWDVATGEVTMTMAGRDEPAQRIAFNSDGKRLITATKGGEVLVYALDLPELIAAARSRVTRTMTPDECRKFLHSDSCNGAPSATPSR